MASLTDKRIKNTYDGLLKTTDNDALGGSYKLITDGLGNSSNVYLGTGGNVGIGASPSTKLHIIDNSDSVIRIQRTGLHDLQLNSDGTITATSTDIKLVASSYISFTADFSEHMRVTGLGNVGIGTDTPGAKLHVSTGNDSNSGNIEFVIGGTNLSNARTASLIKNTSSPYELTIQSSNNPTGSSHLIFKTSGSDERMRIRSDGNVGIGTTNPERQLSLYSNNSETTPRFLIEQDGTGDAVMAFSLTGGQGWSMGIDNSLSDSFMIHNSSGGVDSSSQFTIDTSGNVGIGTISPTSTTLLHISTPQSGAAAGTGLTISGWNGSTESRIQFMSYGIGGGTFALRTGTSNTERMRIDSSGNVGIGTTSPGHKLTVLGGNIQTDGIVYANTIRDNTGGNVVIQDNSGNVGIGTSSPSATLEVQKGSEGNYLIVGGDNASNARALIFSSSTAISNGALHTINAQSGNGQIAFKTGGTEALRIDSSQNIGIGTSSPTSKLHVRGDNPVININDSNSTSRYACLAFSTAGGSWRISSGDSTTGTSSNLFITRAADGTSNRFVFDRDLYRFGVYDNTNTLKAVIRANGNSYFDGGNVGIGTTSPVSPLTVKSNSVSSGNSGLRIEANGSTDAIALIGEKSGNKARLHMYNAGVEKIAFYTDGTNNHISAGNLGIGTTSPNTTLEVGDCDTSDYIDDGNIAVKTNTNDTAIVIQEASGAEQWGLGVNVDGDLIFTDSGTERIRIDDNTGFVGIGTTSPGARLEVNGDIRLTNTTRRFQFANNNVGAYRDTNNRLVLAGYGGIDFNAESVGSGMDSQTRRMRIAADGGLFVYDLLGSSASNPDVRYDTTTGELYYNSSSIRYKEDVTDIESTIDKINKLRPVKFKVKESQQYTTGLIAEEVVEVIPEIVFEREIEGFDKPQIDGVAYNDLHAYYIKAIQEQQQMINDLKRRIEVLENK